MPIADQYEDPWFPGVIRVSPANSVFSENVSFDASLRSLQFQKNCDYSLPSSLLSAPLVVMVLLLPPGPTFELVDRGLL